MYFIPAALTLAAYGVSCLNLRHAQFNYAEDISNHCQRKASPSLFLAREDVFKQSASIQLVRGNLPYTCRISVKTEAGNHLIIVVLIEHAVLKRQCTANPNQILAYSLDESWGTYWGHLPYMKIAETLQNDDEYIEYSAVEYYDDSEESDEKKHSKSDEEYGGEDGGSGEEEDESDEGDQEEDGESGEESEGGEEDESDEEDQEGNESRDDEGARGKTPEDYDNPTAYEKEDDPVLPSSSGVILNEDDEGGTEVLFTKPIKKHNTITKGTGTPFDYEHFLVEELPIADIVPDFQINQSAKVLFNVTDNFFDLFTTRRYTTPSTATLREEDFLTDPFPQRRQYEWTELSTTSVAVSTTTETTVAVSAESNETKVALENRASLHTNSEGKIDKIKISVTEDENVTRRLHLGQIFDNEINIGTISSDDRNDLTVIQKMSLTESKPTTISSNIQVYTQTSKKLSSNLLIQPLVASYTADVKSTTEIKTDFTATTSTNIKSDNKLKELTMSAVMQKKTSNLKKNYLITKTIIANKMTTDSSKDGANIVPVKNRESNVLSKNKWSSKESKTGKPKRTKKHYPSRFHPQMIREKHRKYQHDEGMKVKMPSRQDPVGYQYEDTLYGSPRQRIRKAVKKVIIKDGLQQLKSADLKSFIRAPFRKKKQLKPFYPETSMNEIERARQLAKWNKRNKVARTTKKTRTTRFTPEDSFLHFSNKRKSRFRSKNKSKKIKASGVSHAELVKLFEKEQAEITSRRNYEKAGSAMFSFCNSIARFLITRAFEFPFYSELFDSVDSDITKNAPMGLDNVNDVLDDYYVYTYVHEPLLYSDRKKNKLLFQLNSVKEHLSKVPVLNVCEYMNSTSQKSGLYSVSVNTSRVMLMINNFTFDSLTMFLTTAVSLERQKGECDVSQTECQINGHMLCIGKEVHCDGVPNCGSMSMYDEDRRLCRLYTNPASGMVMALVFVLTMGVVLYMVYFWLARCVPKVADAFFIYTAQEDNSLNLQSVMQSPRGHGIPSTRPTNMGTGTEAAWEEDIFLEQFHQSKWDHFKELFCSVCCKRQVPITLGTDNQSKENLMPMTPFLQIKDKYTQTDDNMDYPRPSTSRLDSPEFTVPTVKDLTLFTSSFSLNTPLIRSQQRKRPSKSNMSDKSVSTEEEIKEYTFGATGAEKPPLATVSYKKKTTFQNRASLISHTVDDIQHINITKQTKQKNAPMRTDKARDNIKKIFGKRSQ